LQHIVGHSELGIPLQHCPMCGPTMVVTRQHQEGDYVYCRHCGGEAKVSRSLGHIHTQPTGKKGSPQDLEPDMDIDLIHELVVLASQHIKHTESPHESL